MTFLLQLSGARSEEKGGNLGGAASLLCSLVVSCALLAFVTHSASTSRCFPGLACKFKVFNSFNTFVNSCLISRKNSTHVSLEKVVILYLLEQHISPSM